MGLLRLLLAAAVVFTHGGGFFNYRIMPANVAVEAFFVISGFLMALVLEKKYDPINGKLLFYSNRLLRLLPTYFIILIFSLVLYLIFYPVGVLYWPNMLDFLSAASPWEIVLLALTTISIVGQESLLFIVQTSSGWQWSSDGLDPLVWTLNPIPPAWSLSLELTFYALAPFLFRLRSKYLISVVVVSLALRVVAYSVGYNFDPWTYRLFPLEIAWFVLGMLAYRHREQLTSHAAIVRLALPVLVGATLLGHPIQNLAARFGHADLIIPMAYLALIAALLPSVFISRSARNFDKWGDLSYPIYLVHWPIMIVLEVLMPGDGLFTETGRTVALMALSVLFAWLVFRIVEVPVNAYRKRRSETPSAIPIVAV